MAFKAAHQVTRLYLDHLRLSAYVRNISANSTTPMIDVTVIDRTENQGAKHFVPDDNTSTFAADGPLDNDDTADLNRDTLTDFKASTSPTPITYEPLGTDGRFHMFEALATNLTVNSARGSSVNWSLAAQTTGATDLNGVALENLTTVTQDTDGTAVDNGAGTSAGGVAHLHVTAYSGLTSDAIIIEHSSTGAFAGEEATLVTFTTVTGLTSQRVEVSGTVDRYLRVVDNVTGTGSITRFVAFSRR